eukprot:GFKZ01015551.1.p1 GENE.GFKZ01015551.1~~GFKZ01015551.1.p1  ORF type:complete len:1193 (+),score=192.35 GFKZ01015551.1:114-3581(+)
MGHTSSLPWNRTTKSTTDACAMFHALDVEQKQYLTLKDLMTATASGLMMPHSLPALYFFDTGKQGTLTKPEFVSLVHFCHSEKQKVEAALSHDTQFRDLILRASKAGVKDCSVHGRTSFRRFSSYSKVRSVFSNRRHPPPAMPTSGLQSAAAGASSSAASSSRLQGGGESAASLPPMYPGVCGGRGGGKAGLRQGVESPVSSDPDAPRGGADGDAVRARTVAMFSAQSEFEEESEASEGDAGEPEWKDPKNRTALDAAVIENIMHANIHKLADLLHEEGSRESFMAWLWNLANFNGSGVVTLEELRVFLAALSDDGIDLDELVFYKEVGVPLEECVINEFDTTHAGLLSRDEFMVLADLVTREYEFWENRHLERIGDYELGRTIGRGSSGVVRLAMHVETREKVAIKIIKKGKCSDLSRLDREIQSLMAARHTHIVALEEVLESKNNLFIVMELCGGGSLVDIVRLYPEERMPEETARFFMRQLFEALAFCHRNGICHRDIRLDNLMLDNNGNVKITDFGHSGIYTPGWDIFSTSLVGSVYNLSPEQVLGNLYSGEKIDIWSAGVAVYCLLVGRPPFFEPEVTPLLERITACDFETPDYLSAKASDLIHCMIRAVPEERITIQQMLHHPWFYDGPEYGPSMNVVVIPVERFFCKRPDIAEMVMAITIYQHNLHFHLGDVQNPRSAPEDHRGQEWTLKCSCPRNDIKFTISLFTNEPIAFPKTDSHQLPAASSYSSLPGTLDAETGHVFQRAGSTGSSAFGQRQQPSSSVDAKHSPTDLGNGSEPEMTGHISKSKPRRMSARPRMQRRMMKLTPLTIAAQLREAIAKGANETLLYNALYDLESDANNNDFAAAPNRAAMLEQASSQRKKETSASGRRRVRKDRRSRSQSLDDPAFMRMNRAVTVDAFPYQKVYPQREMPESARKLNFDMPGPSIGEGTELRDNEEGTSGNVTDEDSSHLHSFHRSVTLQAVSSYNADFVERSLALGGARGNDIAQKLSRHPSKAVSPQSSHMWTGPVGMAEAVEDLTLTSSFAEATVGSGAGEDHESDGRRDDGAEESLDSACLDDFQPFIEVRLSDGESGVFLKICRKLKTICSTKLAAAATRQTAKGDSRGDGEWAIPRSDSVKSLHSDVTAEGTESSGRGSGSFDRRKNCLGS